MERGGRGAPGLDVEPGVRRPDERNPARNRGGWIRTSRTSVRGSGVTVTRPPWNESRSCSAIARRPEGGGSGAPGLGVEAGVRRPDERRPARDRRGGDRTLAFRLRTWRPAVSRHARICATGRWSRCDLEVEKGESLAVQPGSARPHGPSRKSAETTRQGRKESHPRFRSWKPESCC